MVVPKLEGEVDQNITHSFDFSTVLSTIFSVLQKISAMLITHLFPAIRPAGKKPIFPFFTFVTQTPNIYATGRKKLSY